MAKTTKRAKRAPVPQNPFDDPEYRLRADAEDEAWANRFAPSLYALVASLGPEAIARVRLKLARRDLAFQSFLDRVSSSHRRRANDS